MDLAVVFLKNHVEKYLIDVYDRHTREDLVRVWEAELEIRECPICGGSLPKRQQIALNDYKIRGWVCRYCGHHMVVPSDALNYLSKIGGSS